MSRYRLVDTSGSEVGVIADERAQIGEDDTVLTPYGSEAVVVEVYDDETGQEGGVAATLVIEDAPAS